MPPSSTILLGPKFLVRVTPQTMQPLKQVILIFPSIRNKSLIADPTCTDTENKQNLLKKKKPSRKFSEGWVEFKRKRVAKQVALKLNNVRIEERKKSKFYDFIWNIKYLHGFKWVHLSERLSYERAVHQQRVRSEIARAKREASYFSQNIDKSNKIRKRVGNGAPVNVNSSKDIPVYRQRETDSAIRERKKQ
ncbi:unnamed protein product, partial [Timema podura]|nr:unnamed protein product [Timema podura]